MMKSVAVAALLALAPAAGVAVYPQVAAAQSALPAPHVSRALDALLVPASGPTASFFGLDPATKGVLVLAVQPGGLADSFGIEAGDVLDYVQGEEILSPKDLDDIILNWIKQGTTDFTFDGFRAGSAYSSGVVVITLELWEEVIEITEISSWTSYSYESFSYEEYYSEYSEEITTTYEEESVEYSEESTEEVTEESTEEEATDDAGDEGGDEAVDDGADDGGDEAADDGAGEEEAADEGGDEGGDDGGDAGGDEGGDE